MILKLLIIGAIFFALYKVAGGRIAPSRSPRPESDGEPDTPDETLVECRKCGTYTVKKEAIFYKGAYYCSRECLPRK